MCHCITRVVICWSGKLSLTDAFVVLWQAVNCKGQHSISYTLSRNQTVVVEYSHDKDTDMFQVLFCKNKQAPERPLWNIFSSVQLSINSVSACWLRVGKSLSPTSMCLTSTTANQDLWYGTVISEPQDTCSDTWLRMCAWFLGSGLCTRDQVILIVAIEKKSKNRNQQQGQKFSLYI